MSEAASRGDRGGEARREVGAISRGLIDLTGRRVVVTGGNRGIGAACARLFARAGATVCVVYRRNDDAAAGVLAELREVVAGDHLIHRADLRSPEQVERLFASVRRAWSGLDCLVNNAGVWERNPLATFDLETYRRTMDLNVLGSFACAAAALPMLQESSDGNVVNVASTAGQRGEAFYSPYAASKGAMISATKAWACELAPRVRVNAVAPGWVDTDMSAEALSSPRRREIERTIPLGRVANPDEVAGPVLFLASALARHVTGEILNVNGGSVLVG